MALLAQLRSGLDGKIPKLVKQRPLFFEGELWKIHNRLYCRPHLHPAYSMAKGKVNRAAFHLKNSGVEQVWEIL